MYVSILPVDFSYTLLSVSFLFLFKNLYLKTQCSKCKSNISTISMYKIFKIVNSRKNALSHIRNIKKKKHFTNQQKHTEMSKIDSIHLIKKNSVCSTC